jgi:hypothetical protein
MSKARMPQTRRAMLAALGGFALAAGAAKAVIIIGGDNDFRNKVLACFEQFGDDPEAQAILDQMNQPGPRAHRVTIEPTAKGVNVTTPKDDPNASNGTGTDSTVKWNPNNTDPLGPGGVNRDPCAELLHEMKHAAEMDKGQWDTHPPPGGEIRKCEIDACREENRYRKAHDLPQRRSYWGCYPRGDPNCVWRQSPLPPDAVF